jgi:hypothetical protein
MQKHEEEARLIYDEKGGHSVLSCLILPYTPVNLS